MKRILSTFIIAILSVGALNAQNADQIANKFVKAIGAEKWRSIENSRLTISLKQSGFEIPGYIISTSNNQERFELEFSGMKMVQATDGTTAWGMNQFQGQNAPAKLEGEQAEQANEVQFLDEFLDYKKNGSTLTYEGEGTMDGKECHKLKLTSAKGKEEIHFMDKATGMRIATSETVGGQEVVVIYGNYEEVEGMMMAKSLTQKMGGQEVFTINISKVEFNVELADDLFAFPGN